MTAFLIDTSEIGNRLQGDPYEEGMETRWNLGRRQAYISTLGQMIAYAETHAEAAPFGKATSRLLAAAEPFIEKVKPLCGVDLELRQTRKYVGAYQHLDRWEGIGRVSIIANYESWPDDRANIEEAHTVHNLAILTFRREDGPLDEDVILQAVKDTFTQWGCGHEYDCCGCWLKSCYEPEPLLVLPDDDAGNPRRLWAIPVNYSRNL